jgi:MoaA/NifB/PqqE/SkfB family radical SAM enzyme
MHSYKVNFDICTFCNHKCTFCSNADERTLKDKVSYHDFIKVMDNLSQYIKIHELALSAKGEILLNEDLEKIISIAKNKYQIPYIYFSTNGSILNNQKAISLLDTRIDSIKFSINGFSREEYKSIHLKDDFDRVIKNLKEVLLLKKEKYTNTKIFISSVNNKHVNEIKEFFKNLLDDLYLYIDDITKYELQFTPKNELQKNIKIDAKNCLISPFKEIYINSDCTLGFCCKDYFDEINFGSLLHNDFLKLYNSKEYLSMRNRFIDNNFEKDSLCFKCLTYEGLKK